MTLHTDVAPRIQPLATSLVNKIAAGEVIERPANVVKELLENSVDATATRIEVDIEQGGSELIRVTDDGEGIHPDDMELAVASHATSKLQEADDLFRVQTMGFRGEALASIAEISRLRLRSRQPESHAGYELTVEAGKRSGPRPCGCAGGTQVAVRQLFLNTPVRRKYLKTPATEFGHIVEQFTRVALAHPQLAMTLRHNGKAIYELPATLGLLERLEMFYGRTLAEVLIEVGAEHAGVRLWGYIAAPRQSKATRKGQYLFVNGRWIQDRSLQHALGEAFRGLLMSGRYPIAYLFLEVPAEDVDVNVHPTKSEVRFRDPQQLYRLVLSTLRNRFQGMELDSPLDVAGVRAKPQVEVDPAYRQQVQRELVAWAEDELRSQAAGIAGQESGVGSREVGVRGQETGVRGQESGDDRERRGDSAAERGPDALGVPREAAGAEAASEEAEVRAMQVHDCYLVVATDTGLSVVDQHALHERILYERLKTHVLAGEIEVQRLLVPVTVEMSAQEAALLEEHRELLAELGLLIERFSGTTLALSGLPALLHRASAENLLRAVVQLLEERGSQTSQRDLLEPLLQMISCKAAIKAGQRLAKEEIDALLAERHLVADAHHCPHGRPTALTLTRQALDRQFGRLG